MLLLSVEFILMKTVWLNVFRALYIDLSLPTTWSLYSLNQNWDFERLELDGFTLDISSFAKQSLIKIRVRSVGRLWEI